MIFFNINIYIYILKLFQIIKRYIKLKFNGMSPKNSFYLFEHSLTIFDLTISVLVVQLPQGPFWTFGRIATPHAIGRT